MAHEIWTIKWNETFKYGNREFKAIIQVGCESCYFKGKNCLRLRDKNLIPYCNVKYPGFIFTPVTTIVKLDNVKANPMANKPQTTLTAPEGMCFETMEDGTIKIVPIKKIFLKLGKSVLVNSNNYIALTVNVI